MARGPVWSRTGEAGPGGRRRFRGPWSTVEGRDAGGQQGTLARGPGGKGRACKGPGTPPPPASRPNRREAQRRQGAGLSRQAASHARRPWVGVRRVDPSDRPQSGVTFRRTVTGPRGVSPSTRRTTTGTVDPGADGAFEERRGWARTSTVGPENRQRFRSPGSASARVRRACGRRVHPSPRADTSNGHNVVVGAVRRGQEGLAVACTNVCKLKAIQRFRGRCRRSGTVG